ncbi:DUF6929 family protein [Rufibacter sediminis]|uniref:Lipoprotein n=1 Tax=Rufibacter sediminis TaxID=2762756 RepID=A0ABR6VPR5_9BACT|nr:hypothetical protein [Rufibacter sediminis]MBC3538869.1 hypothetical protein [Rufibacter sediminis]
MKFLVQPFSYCTLLLMVLFSAGCQSDSDSSATPTAVITRKVVLDGIPSASGIERVGDFFYVIGDDSPYLFRLDSTFKVVQKVPLFTPGPLAEGRIPKPVKPDLEAITLVTLEGQPCLLIIGSGSTPARNTGYLVPVTRNGVGKPIMVPLQTLYSQLRADKNITGEAALNIEGLAADEEYLYLLQRFAPGGQNVLITYTLSSITPFLLGRGAAPKPSGLQQWALPDLAKIKTGFSGMTSALGGQMLFTASAEETPNAVLDGEVYGSLVGLLQAHPHSSPQPVTPEVVVPITQKDGSSYKSKIESICVLDKHRHSLEAVAVADNDNGFSELVVLTFTW